MSSERSCCGGGVKGAKGNVSAAAAGYNKITKAVSIPGRDVVFVMQQTGVLRGRVEDAETRTPIKEFRIRKASDSTEKSFKSEDGIFEWAEFPIGRSTFVAEAKGYQAAELSEVEIHAGEPSTEVVFSLVKGMKLSGRVVDAATSAGIPDATVTFRVGFETASVTQHNRVDRNARKTKPDGSFEFDNLPAGRVIILAAASLHHAATQRIVVAGEESFVEIKLSIQGSIAGRVFSPNGTPPPAGTMVWIGSPATGMSRSLPTDAAGVFSISNLAAGTYRLTAESPDLGKTPPEDIILREDEHRMGLELRFIVRSGATVRVRVSGLLPGEVVVGLTVEGAGSFLNDSPILDSGTYVFSGVPEGLISLAVLTSSQRMVERSLEISKGAREVTFDIELPHEARLSGRVTQGGRPVGNQPVTVSSSGPKGIMAVARTDPSGVYAVEGLSDGEYRVAVEGRAVRTIRVSGDTVLDIELP